jgi:hypothetical protein
MLKSADNLGWRACEDGARRLKSDMMFTTGHRGNICSKLVHDDNVGPIDTKTLGSFCPGNPPNSRQPSM